MKSLFNGYSTALSGGSVTSGTVSDCSIPLNPLRTENILNHPYAVGSFADTNPQRYIPIITPTTTNINGIMYCLYCSAYLFTKKLSPLPSSLTYINGNVGLSGSPKGSTIYVNFYESTDSYQLKDSSGNVIYQSQALTTIPSQTQVQNAIGDLL